MKKVFDSTKVYGALTVKTTTAIFFDDNGYYKDFFRNGKQIAYAHYTAEGKRDYFRYYKERNPVVLTRAKGFRYWGKYFPNRYVWSLPEELQFAIDLPCVSSGVFYDANGELCGYSG